jgi:hypothetical protein
MEVPQTGCKEASHGASIAHPDLVFEDAGQRELMGVPDRWRLDRVAPR